MRRLGWSVAAVAAGALLGVVAAGGDTRAATGPASSQSPSDTATALLAGVAGTAAPRAILVWPDTVSFGDPFWVALAGTSVLSSSAAGGAEWLEWESPAADQGRRGAWAGPAPPRGWPPPDSGARVAGRVRAYRSGPLRFGWAGQPDLFSTVVNVRPRLPAAAPPAPVRDPRGLGWRGRRLALLALVAAGLVVLLARRWHRRHAPVGPVDAPLPPPAYLAAARALCVLHDEALSKRGEGRRFLDRLAGEIRLYLRARYRVPAPTLTPDEVASALTALGHPVPLAAAGERLLRGCDERRFAPGAATSTACQALLAEAVALIAVGRVPARFTAVPAPLFIEGEAAWARLGALAGVGRTVGSGDGEGRDA